MTQLFKIVLGSHVEIATAAEAFDVGDRMVALAGGGQPTFTPYQAPQAPQAPQASHEAPEASPEAPKRATAWDAKGEKLKRAHERSPLVRDAVESLVSQVQAEGREDLLMSAGELGAGIHVNGIISAHGFKISEQALRGICARIESPALGLLLGLRDRIAAEFSKPEGERNRAGMAIDKETIAEVLRRELRRFPDVPLKLRTRAAQKDIFACVSPSYANCDAPEALGGVVSGLPSDARGNVSYDPKTTAWELRAEIWTPKPVDLVNVGEAFKGYISVQSRDNGTGRLTGSGGTTVLACLNSLTHQMATAGASRVHRGKMALDVERMIAESLKAVDVICAAWGRQRKAEVPLPAKVGITLNEAIPGFWRALLTDRSSAFQGVLPGRTEEHVGALTHAYALERRDPDRLVRSDFVQAWTKYIQVKPADVRREAERAAGAWLVNDAYEMGYVEA